jgi:hypothetical protein
MEGEVLESGLYQIVSDSSRSARLERSPVSWVSHAEFVQCPRARSQIAYHALELDAARSVS